MTQRPAPARAFRQTSALLQSRIRKASEQRGFSEVRLLTRWAEIAGEQTAAVSRPVDISYGRGGFGATLTLLTTGPNAPILEMQKEQIRQRVNSVYGYNAVARIRVTQTAPDGFQDGQVAFETRPNAVQSSPVDPQTARVAHEQTEGIGDTGLRRALEQLAQNVLTKAR